MKYYQIIVCLILPQNGDTKIKGIFPMIKDNHQRNFEVKVVKQTDVFNTPAGLANWLKRNEGKFPYVIGWQIPRKFRGRAIKMATDTGLPFGIVSTNNAGWTSTCINRIVRNNKVQTKNKVFAGTAV